MFYETCAISNGKRSFDSWCLPPSSPASSPDCFEHAKTTNTAAYQTQRLKYSSKRIDLYILPPPERLRLLFDVCMVTAAVRLSHRGALKSWRSSIPNPSLRGIGLPHHLFAQTSQIPVCEESAFRITYLLKRPKSQSERNQPSASLICSNVPNPSLRGISLPHHLFAQTSQIPVCEESAFRITYLLKRPKSQSARNQPSASLICSNVPNPSLRGISLLHHLFAQTSQSPVCEESAFCIIILFVLRWHSVLLEPRSVV